jgi:hypothetical protein
MTKLLRYKGVLDKHNKIATLQGCVRQASLQEFSEREILNSLPEGLGSDNY